MKCADESITMRLDCPEIFLQTAIHRDITGVVFELGYAKDSTIHDIFDPVFGIFLCISKWDYFPLGIDKDKEVSWHCHSKSLAFHWTHNLIFSGLIQVGDINLGVFT